MIAETHFGKEHEWIRLWTCQLYAEFDSLCYQYRLRLRKPVIRVLELNGKWGSWDPNTRTICIARQLIELQNWDATVEVLKHEVAHMIVNDEMGISDHTHGDAFRSACQKLGIAPWASAAEADLMKNRPGDKEFPEEDSRLLRRVEKLLALAGSSNENEALLAMQRVREIYSRYNIERLQKQSQYRDFTYVVINHKKKKIPQHQSMIAGILTSYFFVEAIFCEQYCAQTNEKHKTLEVLGASQNVKMAEYVYYFLLRSLDSLWSKHRREHDAPGSLKRTFFLGVLRGFDTKLKKDSDMVSPAGQSWCFKDPQPEEKDLLVVADQEVEKYLVYRHPRMQTRSYSSSIRDQKTYDAGHKQGEQLIIRKAVESQGTGPIRQLT